MPLPRSLAQLSNEKKAIGNERHLTKMKGHAKLLDLLVLEKTFGQIVILVLNEHTTVNLAVVMMASHSISLSYKKSSALESAQSLICPLLIKHSPSQSRLPPVHHVPWTNVCLRSDPADWG